MAQSMVVRYLCDIHLRLDEETVDGETRYTVLINPVTGEHKLVAMEVCMEHRLALNDVEMQTEFENFGREAKLGQQSSVRAGSIRDLNPKKKRTEGTAVCPICGKGGLEGDMGDVSSRGIQQHVRQVRDEAHQKAYAQYKKNSTWPQQTAVS